MKILQRSDCNFNDALILFIKAGSLKCERVLEYRSWIVRGKYVIQRILYNGYLNDGFDEYNVTIMLADLMLVEGKNEIKIKDRRIIETWIKI